MSDAARAKAQGLVSTWETTGDSYRFHYVYQDAIADALDEYAAEQTAALRALVARLREGYMRDYGGGPSKSCTFCVAISEPDEPEFHYEVCPCRDALLASPEAAP